MTKIVNLNVNGFQWCFDVSLLLNWLNLNDIANRFFTRSSHWILSSPGGQSWQNVIEFSMHSLDQHDQVATLISVSPCTCNIEPCAAVILNHRNGRQLSQRPSGINGSVHTSVPAPPIGDSRPLQWRPSNRFLGSGMIDWSWSEYKKKLSFIIVLILCQVANGRHDEVIELAGASPLRENARLLLSESPLHLQPCWWAY